MTELSLSDLQPEYINNQVNRVKGILNSIQGEDGKALDEEKVLALLAIGVDIYNQLCMARKIEKEKSEQKMDIIKAEVKALNSTEDYEYSSNSDVVSSIAREIY